jgi:hypothetical protein
VNFTCRASNSNNTSFGKNIYVEERQSKVVSRNLNCY